MVAIGGLDPTGGAGLARDLLTATALGGRAILVGTAWTRQDEHGVQGVEPRHPKILRSAIEQALECCPTGRSAVKVGMTVDRTLLSAILEGLRSWRGSVVFDPVLGASRGGTLFQGQRDDMLPLIRRATLVTPNLAEVSWLLGTRVSTREEALQAARTLSTWGGTSFLVKGGHLEGPPVDILCSSVEERLFDGIRVPGESPRGTGCALATAIAIGLASGHPLAQAVSNAKSWLTERIRSAVAVGGSRYL